MKKEQDEIRKPEVLNETEEGLLKKFLLDKKMIALQIDEERKRRIAEEQLFDSGFDDMESYR
jgi:hypothetical protein